MGIKVTGISELEVSLNNIAKRSSRGVRDALEQGAIDIKELARKYAPVDTGTLEEAILLGSEIHGSIQKVNGRNVYTVEVNEDMPNEKGKGVVGDYATYMHEGVYNLGILSEEKQAMQTEIVGRKYLERAMDDLEDDIKKAVEAGMNIGVGH